MKLQEKLVCDLCGTSDVVFASFGETDPSRIKFVFLCAMMHRTELVVRRLA